MILTIAYTIVVFFVGYGCCKCMNRRKYRNVTDADVEMFISYALQNSTLLVEWGEKLPEQFLINAATIVEPMIPLLAEKGK